MAEGNLQLAGESAAMTLTIPTIGYSLLRIFRTGRQVKYVFIALAMERFGFCGDFKADRKHHPVAEACRAYGDIA